MVRLLGSVQNPQTSRSTAFLTRRRAEGKTGKRSHPRRESPLTGWPGASVEACDGAGDWGGAGDLGHFVEPTVLTDTTPYMKVVREEIFGPVVCAIPFGSEDDDVIHSGNDTSFGLASGIWTRDLNKAHRTATACAPARSGSTATACLTPRCRSAATRSRAGAERWATTRSENFLETKSVVTQLA